MAVTKTPAQVCEGIPADSQKQVVNRDLRVLLDEMRLETANAVTGVNVLEPVDLATTEEIALTGEQTIDGTMTNASRILVMYKPDASKNGIYITGSGAWTRAADADTQAEIAGAYVYVTGGTVNGDTAWRVVGNPVVDTDDINFARFAVQPSPVIDSDDVPEGSGNLYMSSADRTKLANIEDGADVNPTAAQIKQAYEGEDDTNAFTDAAKTKLEGIATGAEVNPTNAETAEAVRLASASVKIAPVAADIFTFFDSEDESTPVSLTWGNFTTALASEFPATFASGTTEEAGFKTRLRDGENDFVLSLTEKDELQWGNARAAVVTGDPFSVTDAFGFSLFAVTMDGDAQASGFRSQDVVLTGNVGGEGSLRRDDVNGWALYDEDRHAPMITVGGAVVERPTGPVLVTAKKGQSWYAQNGQAGRAWPQMRTRQALTLNDGAGFAGNNGNAPTAAATGLVYGAETDADVQSVAGPFAWSHVFRARQKGHVPLIIARQEGRGNSEIERLYPDDHPDLLGNGQPWANFIASLRVARDACDAAGLPSVCPMLFFCQYDGNETDNRATYRAKLDILLPAMKAAAEAIFWDQVTPVQIGIVQPPSDATEGREYPLAAQIDFVRENAYATLVCAGWAYPKGDAIHWDADGSSDVGEISALAMAKAAEGEDWSSPYIRDWSISGTTITLNIGGAHPVVADTSIDEPQFRQGGNPIPNLGFSARNGATDLTISSVTVAPWQITVELAASPPSSFELLFAAHDGWGDGESANRGNIRAAWQVQSAIGTGRVLRRWLASDIITITT